MNRPAPSSAGSPRPRAAFRLLAVVLALGVAVACGEALLRWVLFDSSLDTAAKDPADYARDLDELWIYRRLFSHRRGADRGDGPADSRIPFYRDWGTSLEPDATLGLVRRANVRTPCHETTNVGTRGVHDYRDAGPKLVVFGDSFVESAACSDDTLTAKIERLTGIDTLNYGVGGYGLDQIVLAVERVLPRWDRVDCVFVVGLIPNDLERVLLKVRTSPKPYFTPDGDGLALHTDHIHPASLDDAFVRPSGRSYLADLVGARLGHPTYAAYLAGSEAERRAATATIVTRLLARLAHDFAGRRARVVVALLPQPGVTFEPSFGAALGAAGLASLDLQRCLADSRRPDTDLYVELHPTSLGNDLLAACLAHGLGDGLGAR